MALTNCKECSAEISSKAMNCPKCGVVLRKSKRGFFGTVFLWLFILFNVFMLWWLISYSGDIADLSSTGSDAEKSGAIIGGTIGAGMIFIIWLVGSVITGFLALLTKAKN